MDAELKAYLEEMETRLRAHTEAVETRLLTHAEAMETRLLAHTEAMETRLRAHTEAVETSLLTEFWKWARQADARYRQHHGTVNGLDERVALVEDRITAIERGEGRVGKG